MIQPTNPPTSELTKKDIERVAHLARLAISPGSIEDYQRRLGAVLGYVRGLQGLDLEGVEPMTTPFESFNRLAADEPEAGLPTEVLMSMAPEKSEPFIVVPKVLGEGGGA